MKKFIFILCMLIWGNSYSQLFCQQMMASEEETKQTNFLVELDGLVVIVPSSPIDRQCWFVAYRSVHDPYSKQFDQKFFDKALSIFMSHNDSTVLSLKDWGDIFSPVGNLVTKEKFAQFLLRTASEDYNLSTKMLASNNTMEVWQIGKVELYIYKESTKKRKNKILIPEGYYYVTTKQLLN